MITEKEASERKQRIIETAFRLFSEKGVDKATYKDVARLSGISEASIYHYYKKKSYLLVETYRDLWEVVVKELRKSTFRREEFQRLCGYRQMECLLDAYENVYVEHPEYISFALESKLYWKHQSEMVRGEVYDSITFPVIALFADVLKKGVQDNSIHLRCDFNSSCFLIWGIMRAYTEQIVMVDGFYDGDNRFRKYFQVMKQSILASLY